MEEVISLTLRRDTQYQRVSTESDEEVPGIKFSESNKRDDNHSAEKVVVHWNSACIARLFVSFVLLMVATGFAIHSLPPLQHDHSIWKPIHPEEPEEHHVYRKAAVAAGQKECSSVGVDILREGGNAVDAALATLLCQGVVEPEYCGIGGGFFMVIFNATTNQSTFIDARETAPSHSKIDMLKNASLINGPMAIAVPGELKGYWYAYKKYGGDVTWERIFQPAINKSRHGFHVSGQLAMKLQEFKKEIMESEDLRQVFCDPTKKDVKKEKDIIRNLRLAELLERISKDGVDVFYNSSISNTLAKEIQDHGGILTANDLASYEVKERATIKVKLNSDLIYHLPSLPSGGPILGLIMSVMDTYNITKELFKNNQTLYWHRVAESFKHAFGARTWFGDPAFATNANDVATTMLSEQNIFKIRRKIFDNQTFSDPLYYCSKPELDAGRSSSTSHVSVLSPNGDAVAVTSTVNEHFGSKFMSPSTGVFFNNEMGDFITEIVHDNSSREISPNMIEPGKRPLSSMAPGIVVNARTNSSVYIIGAAGGRQIPTAVAISLIELLYFGADDFDDGVRAARLHHQLSPDLLYYEKEFDENILEDLCKLGHVTKEQPPMSHVNGIKNHVSHIHAFSDLRDIGAGADGW